MGYNELPALVFMHPEPRRTPGFNELKHLWPDFSEVLFSHSQGNTVKSTCEVRSQHFFITAKGNSEHIDSCL